MNANVPNVLSFSMMKRARELKCPAAVNDPNSGLACDLFESNAP